MEWTPPLQKATLIKRYKRFLADVCLENGEQLTVHCPNTGSMRSCGSPGATVWVSYSNNPARKLAYTWEYTENATGLIGINTHLPNRLVKEALMEGRLAPFVEVNKWQTEQKYRQSRIDFKGRHSDGRQVWIEVKNVTLWQENRLYFPDAVTARGLKHLEELRHIAEQGHRACLLFTVNRNEAGPIYLAEAIDPAYYRAALAAQRAGVEFHAFRVQADRHGSQLSSIAVEVAIPKGLA
ncbi:MAG: DNA/RNA nuclease SfsA [Zetaproteobacteria bacterium]|nr:DNA/RNA nuclease SfsA [Zetaproteobacteria bacterium]